MSTTTSGKPATEALRNSGLLARCALSRLAAQPAYSPEARPPEHPTAPSSTQLSGQVALQACACGLHLPPAAPHPAPRAGSDSSQAQKVSGTSGGVRLD